MEQIHRPKKVPLHPFKVNFSLVLNPATYNFSVPYNLAFSRMLYKWKNSAYTLLDLGFFKQNAFEVRPRRRHDQFSLLLLSGVPPDGCTRCSAGWPHQFVYLGCFQLGTTRNKTSTNICTRAFVWTHSHFSCEGHHEVVWSGHV